MWTTFFSTAAETAATLAGLVIVALSVNLTRILQYPHLPARAGATIATLILVLLSSMATLIPQPLRTLGAELAFFGLICWLFEIRSSRKAIAARVEAHRPWIESAIQVFFGQLQSLPFIIGGVLMLYNNPVGLYGIAIGIMVILFASVANAWVLMVEILR